MAVRIEITKAAFRLDIELGQEDPPVEKEDITAVTNGALSFIESKACTDEDLPDGVEIAGQIHPTAEKDDVGWKVGKDYAKWGDELFKDPAKKQELLQILQPLVDKAFKEGGHLLKRAMKAILCDKLGLVSEIRIERIASLFLLCWNLFKTAVIAYSVVKAFEVLGKILKHVILFLQETRFFEKLREMGGWIGLQQLVRSYRPAITITSVKYLTVATTAAIAGGLAVYLFLKYKD